MKNNSVIRNGRQERAVRALLERTSIGVKALGGIIGSLNPCDVIMHLRKQGLEGIIQTRRFKMIDRDEEICWPGEYYVDPKDKPILEEALKRYAAQYKVSTKAANQLDNSSLSKGRL